MAVGAGLAAVGAAGAAAAATGAAEIVVAVAGAAGAAARVARAVGIVAAMAGASGIVAAALTGAKWRAVADAVLGQSAVGAPGLELTAGGGEVLCTHGRKE